MQISCVLVLALIGSVAPFTGGAGGDHHGHHEHHGHNENDVDQSDPHSGKFCVNLNKWGPIFYKSTEKQVCTTEFKKKCIDHKEQVCTLEN